MLSDVASASSADRCDTTARGLVDEIASTGGIVGFRTKPEKSLVGEYAGTWNRWLSPPQVRHERRIQLQNECAYLGFGKPASDAQEARKHEKRRH